MAKKHYHIVYLDYKTGVFDTVLKRRVDGKLPKKIRDAGIYNRTPEYEWFKKHNSQRTDTLKLPKRERKKR